MKKIFSLGLAMAFLWSFCWVPVGLTEESGPPLPYLKKNACPFECCRFGRWVLLEETKVYSKPDRQARAIATLPKGSVVTASTGEAHTLRLGEVLVEKDVTVDTDTEPISLKTGDRLYEMDPVGEGFVNVWYKGRVYEIMPGWLSERFWTDEEHVWGKLQNDPETDWWVKVRIKKTGRTGWIVNPKAKGMSSCG